MDIVLSEIEVRILGCLIEKEMATPEYYPLSLNALTSACNQKSNRDPVVSYDEAGVERGLGGLQQKGLVRKVLTSGGRVTKYSHSLLDRFDLSRQDMSVLCELMLRGPQTVGEIRSHTDRLSAGFRGLEEAEASLRGLSEHDPPLAVKMPREAGRKEQRYRHLFAGALEALADHASGASDRAPGEDRIGLLERELSGIRGELEELKRAFAEFKAHIEEML